MKRRMVLVACSLAVLTGCATLNAEAQLPPVKMLENWRKPFSAWSKGVDFPVTVVVVPEGGGGFFAYGVDPDRRKIHFVAESRMQEHLRELAGDPMFGTVVVIGGKSLGRTDVKGATGQGWPTSRVQVAVDIARAAYLAVGTVSQL